MTVPDGSELIARWKHEPAPLLPVLHAFHDRDGYLSDEALGEIAVGLRIPLADLFGTVSFYHHFSREPGDLNAPRVCSGPVYKPDPSRRRPPLPKVWRSVSSTVFVDVSGRASTGIRMEAVTTR